MFRFDVRPDYKYQPNKAHLKIPKLYDRLRQFEQPASSGESISLVKPLDVGMLVVGSRVMESKFIDAKTGLSSVSHGACKNPFLPKGVAPQAD